MCLLFLKGKRNMEKEYENSREERSGVLSGASSLACMHIAFSKPYNAARDTLDYISFHVAGRDEPFCPDLTHRWDGEIVRKGIGKGVAVPSKVIVISLDALPGVGFFEKMSRIRNVEANQVYHKERERQNVPIMCIIFEDSDTGDTFPLPEEFLKFL